MAYFTCDACHYIFRSDDIPSSCPGCGASSVVARNDTGRKFQVPAIRLSTEAEMEQGRLADQAESSHKSFLERVRGLSGYTLSDDEYHMALMLLSISSPHRRNLPQNTWMTYFMGKTLILKAG